MKLKLNFKKVISLGILVLFIGLSGCKDLFTNPLKDKNTGEDVTLLLLDRNFITTQLSVTLVDIKTQEQIGGGAVEIKFSGADAANLITFGGNKETTYTTSSGYVEVGYDPNVAVDSQNPLELTVMATSTNYVGLPQFVSYTTKGIKNIVIQMIPTPSVKSAKVGASAYSEPFDMTFNGTKSSAALAFGGDLSGFNTGNGYNYLNFYIPTVSGSLVCNNLHDNITYADYGVYYDLFLPPNLPSKNAILSNSSFVYSVVQPTGWVKCSSGLTINVKRSDNLAIGSGVFNYKITFATGAPITGMITCSFPSVNLIEPIYYPTSDPITNVELTGDGQFDISPAVSFNSPCGATANFIATPKAGLTAYKLVTNYKCPNSSVAAALTISGKFRIKGSTGAWTGFNFVGGVCYLTLKSGAEYDFSVNIDGTSYSYAIPTDPALVASYLNNTTSTDYQIKALNVTTDQTTGNVTIMADVEFTSGDICDKLK